MPVIMTGISTSLADDLAPLKDALEAKRGELVAGGIARGGGWILAYGRARILSDSSASHRAATAKARLDAVGSIQRHVFLQGLDQQLSALPQVWRGRFTDVLTRNLSGEITLRGGQVIESGEDKDGAWMFYGVPEVNVTSNAGPASIRESVQLLIGDTKNILSSEDADYIYEAAAHYGLPDTRLAWVQAQPELLRPQLLGKPASGGIRFWVENRAQIEAIITEITDPVDIKKAMMALPYCKELIDRLSADLRERGLTQAAREVTSIHPAVPLSALHRLDDEDLSREAGEAGLAEDCVIRLLIFTDGQYPTVGESPTAAYEHAMAQYRSGDMTAALPLCVAAFRESYNADTINVLGAVLRRCGYVRLGAVLCRQALFMDPEHPYAAINTALCYEALARDQDAVSYARRALSNAKADAWAREEAQKILAQ